jgi:ribonuclease BN (tRNA processing enzyme)
MRLTVLGGCGGWPAAGLACSGYLVEHDGFRLLIDPGYATLPRLLTLAGPDEVDAVLVSHGHPDHCADLNPLLRARALRDDDPAPAVAVYAPVGELGPVLALDRPGMLDDAIALREFTPGDRLEVGPFGVRSWLLPHWRPNAGLRLEAGGRTLAYTGDSGPSPLLADLARDADIFLAEATYPWQVPGDVAPYLSSARQAGEVASQAGTGQLVLTHLWPGTDPDESVRAAAGTYPGPIAVAVPGLVAEPAPRGE